MFQPNPLDRLSATTSAPQGPGRAGPGGPPAWGAGGVRSRRLGRVCEVRYRARTSAGIPVTGHTVLPWAACSGGPVERGTCARRRDWVVVHAGCSGAVQVRWVPPAGGVWVVMDP